MKKEEFSFAKTIDTVILLTIICVAFAFRLYKINTPLADLHSWRQADTAAVGRNFVKQGFDFLHPRYDDLSNVQSGKENPQGYRFVEFPIYNALFALSSKLAPVFPIEVHGRIVTILFSLVTIGVIYYLARKEAGRIAAIAASATFAIMPFFVFFSRVVLPDPAATSLAFLAIFFLYKALDFESKQFKQFLIFYVLSFISFASALLVKPTVIFYALPLLYLFIDRYKISILKNIWFYLYFVLGFIPLLMWRQYIQAYPEGIPASGWLITSVNTFEGQKNIFLKPAFFRWIFFERINNYIFGGYVLVLFIIGILTKNRRYFLHTILAAALLYLFVFEGGNVQHEYYQILILPALALFVGLGTQFILTNTKNNINRVAAYPILIIVIILGFSFSYYKVKDYYATPSDLPQIANIIQTLTKEDDKIVTDRLGDTTLLYLANRKGAPAVYKSTIELKQQGYKYLVTADPHMISDLKKDLKVVFQNDTFILFKL